MSVSSTESNEQEDVQEQTEDLTPAKELGFGKHYRRKKTLEERQADTRYRIKLQELQERMSDPALLAVRAKRLRLIRKRCGLSRPQFARLLGISPKYLEHIEMDGRTFVRSISMIAEHILRRYHRRRVKKLPPVEFRPTITQRRQVLSLYIEGKTAREIAEKLALRPEIVSYYLQGLDV